MDIRFLNNKVTPFYIGQKVALYSEPHGISSDDLIIAKIECDVMELTKKVTLGTIPKDNLSDIAGRGNIYDAGPKVKKVKSKSKVKATDSSILFIPA